MIQDLLYRYFHLFCFLSNQIEQMAMLTNRSSQIFVINIPRMKPSGISVGLSNEVHFN